MNKFIPDPVFPTWPAREYHLKHMMGLSPKAKWPDTGMAAKTVSGITLYVLSAADAKARGVFHRARCVCPQCGADVGAGRLAQHKCKD